MKDNYRNGGADYTTKTVSQTVTITLVSNTVEIEANKDTVVRGEPFSVTVNGKGVTFYHLWVTNTSDLAGGPDGQPPMVNLNQSGVRLDANQGSEAAQRAYAVSTSGSALGYAYANATTGRVVFDDVAHSADTGYGTRTGFNIVTPVSGTRTIEFVTTNWTRAQKYTIHVEQNFGSVESPSFRIDEVDVTVETGSAPVAGFTVNVTSGTAPLTVEFTDISTGVITDSYMEFGDGTEGNFTGASLLHTYTREGTFFPVIHVTDGITSDSGTDAAISVNVVPDLEPDLAEAYNIVLNDPEILNGTSTGVSVSASPVLIPAGSQVEQWGERTPIDLPDEAGILYLHR